MLQLRWRHPFICVKTLKAPRLSDLSKVVQWRCSGSATTQSRDKWCPNSSCFLVVRSTLWPRYKVSALRGHGLPARSSEVSEAGPMTRRRGGRTGPALTFFCTHGLNWPPYPCCRVSAQSELRSSKCCASQSGHASSDGPSVEILLGPPHSTHICNTSSCLRLQGCFVVRA